MPRIFLDMKGRLIEFQAIPRDEQPKTAAPSLVWPRLLHDAGLKDMLETKEFLENWAPPMFVDERLAWQGSYADCPDVPVRAEAGLVRGRLAFFHVAPNQGPDQRMVLHAQSAVTPKPESHLAAIVAGLHVAVWTIGIALAWHNTRCGRSNLRGATILSLAIFGAYLLAWVFSAHHVPRFWDIQQIFTAELGDNIYLAAFIFVLYLAMEPFVRRRWPWRVVAWNRLLAGRWRDPLVGRDVLVGALAGAVSSLLFKLSILAPLWLGRPMEEVEKLYSPLLTCSPMVALATIFVQAVVPTLAGFFTIFVFFLLSRRDWIAAIIYALVWAVPVCLAPTENRDVLIVSIVAFSMLLVFMYLRFGLLAVAAASIPSQIVSVAPVTFNFSAWYASDSIVYLAVLIGLVLYGFVVSSGGQALAWVTHLTGEANAKVEAALD